MLLRVVNSKDWVDLQVGEVILVRGQILAHDKLLGEDVTIVETSSVPTNI